MDYEMASSAMGLSENGVPSGHPNIQYEHFPIDIAILGYLGILHFWTNLYILMLYLVAVVILCGCRITTSMRQQHVQTFLSEQATNTRPVECKVVLVYH